MYYSLCKKCENFWITLYMFKLNLVDPEDAKGGPKVMQNLLAALDEDAKAGEEIGDALDLGMEEVEMNEASKQRLAEVDEQLQVDAGLFDKPMDVHQPKYKVAELYAICGDNEDEEKAAEQAGRAKCFVKIRVAVEENPLHEYFKDNPFSYAVEEEKLERANRLVAKLNAVSTGSR